MASYKIPKPFQDEDKYFRFFTKKQILFIGVPLALTVLVLAKLWDAPKIVIFFVSMICVAVLLACVVFSSFKMPKDKYLWGGGTSLERLGRRLIQKQTKKKKILWVKNYGDHGVEPEKNKKDLLSKIFKIDD